MQCYWTSALLLIPLATLTACVAHPLPEDVTRKSTFTIVQQLRCEARDGIIKANLSEEVLEGTYIGFDFSFDITESNTAANGSLAFTELFSGGKLLLNFKGGVDKKRQAERFFRVVQLFKDLRADTSCSDGTPYANLAYPITGKIGLDEVVGTYAALTGLTSLRKSKNNSLFSDELTFTTTLDAGIVPTLEFNGIAGKFRLTKASLDGSVERKDVHKVTIVITAKADIKATDIAQLLSEDVSPGFGTDARNVIQELDRLRSRNDDSRALESLRALQ